MTTTNHYYIPVSFGEVVDKITILNIKLIKVEDKSEQQRNIKHELNRLETYQRNEDKTYVSLRSQLFAINWHLWNLEDRIREKSDYQEFDQEYIDIAEDIHQSNDKRYQIKRKINRYYQSDIQEEKIYS